MVEMYDKSNMKGIIKNFAEQIRDAYAIDTNIALKGALHNIVICGVGSSSIAGQILGSYLKMLDISIPVINLQSYNIPSSIDKNSLIFICSYSGDTEEAISCLREAIKKGHHIVVVMSGGKLLELTDSGHLPRIIVPKGLQPRNAIAYMFFPMLRVLENSGIIANQSDKVKDLISSLKRNDSAYDKGAQELAEKLANKLPIIYSSEIFYSIAYRWKCEFNENAKIPSFCNKFPELNHNELMGYLSIQSLNIPAHIILLKDESDNKRILKRMEITKKLIKDATGNKVTFTDITIRGDNLLTKMFTTVYLGDLTSYYLALKNGMDPTLAELIEKFKKEMGPYIQ